MLTRESIQTASAAAIEVIQALLEDCAKNAQGSQIDLDEALLVQGDIDDSIASITSKLDELHVAVSKRTEQARVNAASHTLDRVADLVKTGHLSIEELLVRLGAAPAVIQPAATNANERPAVAAPGAVLGCAAPVAPAADATGVSDKAKGAGTKLPPLYAHPTSGESWTGRGPVPKWLKELLVNGKSKDDFRIKPAGSAPATPSEGRATGTTGEVAKHDAAAAEPGPRADTAAVGAGSPVPAPTGETDIGESMSFDGGIDDDIDDVTPTAANDGDIGEMLVGLSDPGTEIRLFAVRAAA